MATTPSIAGIFGVDLSEFGSLLVFLIFVFLVASNASAFSQLLRASGAVTVDAVKVLQGR